MKISLSVKTYKGADGSGLSKARCNQILLIYKMLEQMGEKKITYVQLQDAATTNKIFGKTKGKSAVRTFFPLLSKLGFVDYKAGDKGASFPANKCFTDLGKQFVLANRALSMIQEDTPNKEAIISRLENIISNTIKQGIINMNHDPDLKSHNIWVALRILSEFSSIDWNEFLYALHCLEEGLDMDKAINLIREKRDEISTYEFTKKDGKPLANTCYSYIRGLLLQAGLIVNINYRKSKLTEEAQFFLTQINL